MSKDNAGEDARRIIEGGLPPTPSLDILHTRERAKTYLETVMWLYSSLASDEEDPDRKVEFEAERVRHSNSLKSLAWMETAEAQRIVAEYPRLIDRLRAQDKWSSP